jgi:hypothetical protein
MRLIGIARRYGNIRWLPAGLQQAHRLLRPADLLEVLLRKAGGIPKVTLQRAFRSRKAHEPQSARHDRVLPQHSGREQFGGDKLGIVISRQRQIEMGQQEPLAFNRQEFDDRAVGRHWSGLEEKVRSKGNDDRDLPGLVRHARRLALLPGQKGQMRPIRFFNVNEIPRSVGRGIVNPVCQGLRSPHRVYGLDGRTAAVENLCQGRSQPCMR